MRILSSDNSLGIGATLLTVFCIIVVKVAIRASLYSGSGEFAVFEKLIELTEPLYESAEAASVATDAALTHLQDVRDRATAETAAASLPQLMQGYRDAMDDLEAAESDFEEGIAELTAEYGEEEFEDIDEKESAHGSTLVDTTQQLVDEFDRISEIAELPVEFWDVMRVERARLALYALEATGEGESIGPFSADMHEQYGAVLSVLETHGPQQVVSISLANVTEDQFVETSEKCSKVAGDGVQVSQWYDQSLSEGAIVISPTQQWDAFLAAMPTGLVQRQDPASREIAIAVVVAPKEDQSEFTEVAEDPEETVDELIAETPESLVPDSDATISSPETEPVEPIGAEVEIVQIETEPRASIAQEPPPIKTQSVEAEETAGLPAIEDPDYHKKLADLMLDQGNEILHQEVLDILLETSPSNIKNKSTFKQIARNFRQLALEADEDPTLGKSIQGLAHYGGKYCVPILLEMLEKDRAEIHDEFFTTLERFPSKESAMALVQMLGDQPHHERIVASLQQMGPVAEKALFTIARDEDPNISAAALGLLGKVGTPDSFGILRRVIKGNNKEDRELAKSAMKEIRLREAAASQTAASR